MPDGLPAIDPEQLARRIGSLLAQRRTGAVRPLLAALTRLAPAHENLALLQAGYWCEMQDFAQALAVLAVAIAGRPDRAGLWLRQAEILFGQGEYEAAAQSAAQAVLLAPALDIAKARLGLALMRLGKFDQALSCLAEYFAAHPGDAEIALAMAALASANAIEILNRAIAANPKAAVLRNALARRYACGENFGLAKSVALAAIAAGIGDAQTYCLLAYAEMAVADWDEAVRAVGRAQSIAPESVWAGRLAAALSSRLSGRLYPADADADAAEQALVGGGGIAPGAFRALLEQAEMTGPVLDVFCGTGLNAIAAQGLELGPWTGVDPRAGLIESCAARGLYAGLHTTDPLLALAGDRHPVILLNEALGSMQSPQAWLAGIRNCLTAGGLALAAIPIGSGLNGHGLFGQREADLARHAGLAGLSFEVSRHSVLRHLEGLPVRGVIASFRRI